MRIIMIRHAEAVCNVLPDDSLLETYDPNCELTARGKRQAMLLRDRYPKGLEPVAIYSSPYKRAVDTAQPLRERFRVPLILDERLGEVRAPERFDPPITQREWDRLLEDRIRYPDRELVLGLEPLTVQMERIADFCTDLIRQYKHRDANLVLMTHAFCIQLMLLHLLGLGLQTLRSWRVKVSNTAMHIVRVSEDNPCCIEALNNRLHLRRI